MTFGLNMALLLFFFFHMLQVKNGFYIILMIEKKSRVVFYDSCNECFSIYK